MRTKKSRKYQYWSCALVLLAAVAVVLAWSHNNPAARYFKSGHLDGGVQVYLTLANPGDVGEERTVLRAGSIDGATFCGVVRDASFWRPLWEPIHLFGEKDLPLWYFEFFADGVLHFGELPKSRRYLLLDGEWFLICGRNVYEALLETEMLTE